MGLNTNGLPLGVQVIGPSGHDHVTIAVCDLLLSNRDTYISKVAQALEKAAQGWVPPFQYHEKDMN